MATNMDKALYPAPMGIDEGVEVEPIEIEIEDPESVAIHLGDLDIEIRPDTGEDFSSNLAEFMDKGALTALGSALAEMVEADINSRKDWADTFVKGLEVLGMRYEERTEPWNGACGVYSTVLAEAAIRFQSETIIETFPAAGPVKTEIIGDADKDSEDAADRVRDDMNFRLTEEMPEYRPEHERRDFRIRAGGTLKPSDIER